MINGGSIHSSQEGQSGDQLSNLTAKPKASKRQLKIGKDIISISSVVPSEGPQSLNLLHSKIPNDNSSLNLTEELHAIKNNSEHSNLPSDIGEDTIQIPKGVFPDDMQSLNSLRDKIQNEVEENNVEPSNWQLEIGGETRQIQPRVLPDEMPNDKTPNNEPWQFAAIPDVPDYVPNVKIYNNGKLFYEGSLKNGWLSKGEVYDLTGISVYNGRIEKGLRKINKCTWVHKDKEIDFNDVFDDNWGQIKKFPDNVASNGTIGNVKIYMNNVLFYEGSVENGWLKDGRLYDENGKLKFEGSFKEGKMSIGHEVISTNFDLFNSSFLEFLIGTSTS